MMSYVFIALLLISPAWAGKKKGEPPPVAPVPAAPAIDPAFEADIRRLLEASGAGALGAQVMEQMLVAFRPMAPEGPESFWIELKAEMDPTQLVELTVPVYARHLSHADVKDLLVFYESPIGRKMLVVQPAITADSMAVGQAWGQEIGARVVQRLQGGTGK